MNKKCIHSYLNDLTMFIPHIKKKRFFNRNNTTLSIIFFKSPLLLILQRYQFIEPRMKKKPCKFKQNCSNFKAGKECHYSHDRCKFGDKCNDKANCSFIHDASGSPFKPSQSIGRKEFSQSKNEVQCKFGARCKYIALGKCSFKHSAPSIKNEPSGQPPQKIFELPKHETPCQFGARCNMFPFGKCPFKHDPATTSLKSRNFMEAQPPHEDSSQSFRSVLSGLCFDFLMNRTENEQCGKLHQFTTKKNIKKIFQADNQKITKCSLFQCYQQDEQPIYAVLTQGRIVFGQLINLAKESGMEHINNSSLIFKRCYDKDIAFHNQAIEDFYLLHSICQEYPRIDILVIKGSRNIHVCLINYGTFKTISNNRNILSAIFIKSHLLISFQDNSKLFLRFDPSSLDFHEDNCPITYPLHSFRGHFKKLYDSQIIGSIMNDKAACFINEKFETYLVQFEEKVKDLLILELEGSPSAFVLTDKQLCFVNLVTFQKKSLLEGVLGQDLTFSSMAYTLDHLFLALDGWGILIYNTNNLESPAGVLCLGDRQWKLQTDDRGNLSLISREKDGYSSWWIFKVRRH